MARIQSSARHPIRVGSRTHHPVKLVGMRAPLAPKPVPEQPEGTSRRVTAGQQARIARALKGNRYLHLTR